MSELPQDGVLKDMSAPLIGDIGLCMSGGGYRAAAFHLGTLAYIEKLALGKNLSAISTVSGGTFTGTKYIISLVEKQSFSHFFSEYYYALKNTHLLAEGLEALAAQKNDVASGRQDLIVSMAQVYSETLFCKKDASGNPSTPYYFDTILNGEQPIGDVMLNATDFRSGIAFRFQRSADKHATIGNFYNNIDSRDAAKIRLADIVAASSCFPGGFEPLSFPYDFTWQGGEIPERVTFAFPTERSATDAADPRGPVPLMDGGVYDNQGLESLLLADERNNHNLDLVIISDVDKPSLELYEMPEPCNYGGISLGTLGKLGLGFFWLCLGTLVTIAAYAWQDFSNDGLPLGRGLFLYLLPFCLTAIAALCVYFIRTVMREDVLPQIPLIGDRAWKYLKQLTTGQVRNMLRLRVTSLLALTTSVFMKRIRSLVYQLAYGDGREIYNGKRLSNLIYSLSPAKTRNEPIKGMGKPSELLDKVACVAFNQPTTLWFDSAYQQPCLIASGQASMCYNMLKLFAVRYGSDPAKYDAQVTAMWQKLDADWHAFNTDPFFLLKDSVKENWSNILQEIQDKKGDWGMFEGKIPTLSVAK
jgi:predicted acylesterase/phospholipase RssA